MKPKRRKPKKKAAWDWCSKYIRLRDAILFCEENGIDICQFVRVEDIPVRCCTCLIIKPWSKMDAGHFISRGSGGHSGVYFDERNIHAQSKDCNGFKQGATLAYQDFMREKYGQAVIDELRLKDKLPHRCGALELRAWEIFYKSKFEDVKKEIGFS